MDDGVFVIVILTYIITAFVIGTLGDSREIGMWPAFFISLLLSPLIGAIIVAASSKKQIQKSLTPGLKQLLRVAAEKKRNGDLDGALTDYLTVITYAPKAPNTNLQIAAIYSLLKNESSSLKHLSMAVEQGYDDFETIHKAHEFEYLRSQPEYIQFARNGYRLPKTKDQPKDQPDDVVGQIERLGKLKDQGYLTDDEFQVQKKKVLDS